MRVSRELVAQRETFVREVFTKNPETTVAQVNEQLRDKFGQSMNAKRLNELKNEVLASGSEVDV